MARPAKSRPTPASPVVVPAFLVQQVDGAERAAVPHDRQVEDRAAAERGDQRVVEEHALHVGGRPPQVRLLARQHPLGPRRDVERLAAAHRVLARMGGVDPLRFAGRRVVAHQREELVAQDRAERGVERAEERLGLAGHGARRPPPRPGEGERRLPAPCSSRGLHAGDALGQQPGRPEAQHDQQAGADGAARAPPRPAPA